MTTNTPIVPTPMFTASIKARFWMNLGSDRTRQAIALRGQGHTYQEIADRLGYTHRMGAYWAVNNSVIAKGMARKRVVVAQDATKGRNRQNPLSDECNERTGDPVNAERRAA